MLNIYEPPSIYFKKRWQIHRPIPMHHASRLANAIRKDGYANRVSFSETYLRGMFTAIATHTDSEKDKKQVVCAYVTPALWRRCMDIHLTRNPKADTLLIGGYRIESNAALPLAVKADLFEKTVWTPDELKAIEEVFI